MIISLLTDFGIEDGFVGSVKGVIKTINPSVDIIDISHNVGSFDILEGALVLKAAYLYFPKGTIFTVVVDPGVGSERDAIIVKTKDYFFVAPDNGVISLAVENEKIEKIIKIQNEEFFLTRDNNTFHGRDIFAPVSAYISKGVPVESFGKEKNNIIKVDIPRPEIKNGKIYGKIIKFDKFGNGITNIEDIPSFKRGEVRGIKIEKLASSFLEGEKGKLNIIKGSFGFYEIFVPLGSAKDMFKLDKEDEVVIRV